MSDNSGLRSPAFRVAAIYLCVGLAWIWFSDRAILWLGLPQEHGFLAATAKGSAFVALSAGLIFWLIRRETTTRKWAENHFRMLEACMHRLNDIVLVTEVEPLDEPGPCIVFVNDAFVARTGYEREEVLGRSPRFLQGPKTDRAALDRIRAAMRSAEPVRVELINYKKGGEEFCVEIDIAPVPDSQGRITHSVSVQRDVTAQKKAAEALHDRTARLAAVLETAADAIVTIDENGVIESANPATERMFGYTPAEMVGRNVTLLMPPPYRDEHDGYLARYAATGVKRIIGIGREVRGRRKDGTEFPMDLAVSEASAGRRWFTGIIRDISERKKAEAALRDQAELLDKVTNAIVVRDMAGRVTYWNQAAENLYGWAAAEVLGSGNPGWVEPPYIGETVWKDGRWEGELTRVTKDGRRVVVESHQTLIRAADGTPKGVIAISIDATDRKELESRVLRAQRLESIGALASGIAHDLNNVLTPVLMAVRLLQRDKPGVDKPALLATAQASIERGSGMIRQLLTFGGGLTGEHTPVLPNTLVTEVREMLEHTLPKSISILSAVPDGLRRVNGDATQLTQVLVNLCVNARDAMPDGGTIRLRAENVSLDEHRVAEYPGAKPGPYVLLAVEDTGTGIPPEVQERMFDPFFTTKPFGQGTGLGLATVQGIVKSHGGFLSVYSEPGKGSNFMVYLPADPGTGAVEGVGPVRAGEQGQGELILVIDDEANVRTMTAAVLQSYGYRTITAPDGLAGVEEFRRNRGAVAAVILDMMMPGQDGPATLRALRAIDPALRVVAVSGLQPAGAAAADLAKHGAVFLAKPFTDDAILTALGKALRGE